MATNFSDSPSQPADRSYTLLPKGEVIRSVLAAESPLFGGIANPRRR